MDINYFVLHVWNLGNHPPKHNGEMFKVGLFVAYTAAAVPEAADFFLVEEMTRKKTGLAIVGLTHHNAASFGRLAELKNRGCTR